MDELNFPKSLLEKKIKLKPSYTNSHFFLMQFFNKIFGFMPSLVFYNEYSVFYFLCSKKYNMIQAKFSDKKNELVKKFIKNLFLISYDDFITLDKFIHNLFPHVFIHLLEYQIEETNRNTISIFVYVKECKLKFCLGQGGYYIKSINEILHSYLDKRITLYLRSLGI